MADKPNNLANIKTLSEEIKQILLTMSEEIKEIKAIDLPNEGHKIISPLKIASEINNSIKKVENFPAQNLESVKEIPDSSVKEKTQVEQIREMEIDYNKQVNEIAKDDDIINQKKKAAYKSLQTLNMIQNQYLLNVIQNLKSQIVELKENIKIYEK
jgi:hypothetical protein